LTVTFACPNWRETYKSRPPSSRKSSEVYVCPRQCDVKYVAHRLALR
jgi:predicted RNA-binding Zn-ribbon protein involved in translation (DUF1610 family)